MQTHQQYRTPVLPQHGTSAGSDRKIAQIIIVRKSRTATNQENTMNFTTLAASAIVLFTYAFAVTPDEYPEQWTNKGKGRTFVLYRKHDVTAMSQGQVGSCVGCAAAKAIEMMHGVKVSPEWLYARSRSYFGSTHPYKAGSQCGWVAQMIRDIGVVPSMDYPILGYDLSKYDASLAYNWQRGPPEVLDQIAKNYKSPGFYKIETWEQLRDSISQGIPVICGSSVGFGSKSVQVRSSSGMLRSRWWSRWNHAMVFCGVSDGKSKRALLLNSWGNNWIRGPKWLGDEPNGSFWISKRDAEKILSYDDCWAVLPIQGLPR